MDRLLYLMHHTLMHHTTARSERAASLVEYALLVALIAVVLISAVTFFGEASGGSLVDSSTKVRDAVDR